MRAKILVIFSLIFCLAFTFFFFILCPQKKSLLGSARNQTILRDALGYEFQLGQPPQKIISLAPNLTEILFELGLGDKIVGVTRFCNYPPAVNKIERVGGLLDPSLERITALQPDLILAFRGTPLEVLNKIRASSLRLFVFDEGQRLKELFSLIKTVGLVTRSEDRALELTNELELHLREIEKKIQATTSRPKVLVTLSSPGLWTCGRESFLNDLIEIAGGQNVAAFESKRWFSWRMEDLIQASPEIIVILAPDLNSYLAKKEFFLKEKALKTIKAIQANRFGWVNEDEASRFGPRLIKALETFARHFHPDVFN